MSAILRKVALVILAAMALLVSLVPQPAFAHGERAAEPYIRTRTVLWYDVTWSADKLNVNDTVTIQGKFHLLDDWPDSVSRPNLVFLSNGSPGAVMTRVESYINDIPARQSTKDLVIGRDYDFKLVMKARKVGRWHLHPVLNIHGAGAVVGPGEWVAVTGNEAEFKDALTTLTGNKIDDLQTFGVARVQIWQFGFGLIAAAWLLWWLRRPLIISRWLVVRKGREDLLITPMDDKVAAGLLVVVLLVVVVGYTRTTAEFPELVPLQSGSLYTPPLPKPPHTVEVKFKRAEYDVPGRSMRLSVEMTNSSDRPVSIGEFTTANLRFVNKSLPAAMATISPKFPKDLIPRSGLVIDNPTPLAPGETRSVKLDTTDAAWEVERLVSFLSNVDSRMGGLIFFYDDKGNRSMSEVYGPIIPVFKKTI